MYNPIKQLKQLKEPRKAQLRIIATVMIAVFSLASLVSFASMTLTQKVEAETVTVDDDGVITVTADTREVDGGNSCGGKSYSYTYECKLYLIWDPNNAKLTIKAFVASNVDGSANLSYADSASVYNSDVHVENETELACFGTKSGCYAKNSTHSFEYTGSDALKILQAKCLVLYSNYSSYDSESDTDESERGLVKMSPSGVSELDSARSALSEYTVTFNANGGTGTMADQTMTAGTASALNKNTFTRTGYTFQGWSTSSSATSATYTDGQSVSLSSTAGGTVTLYAVWKANTYTVQYDGNGSTSGSTASSTHTYDAESSLTLNGFSKTGYTFQNWNTAADGTGETYADGASILNLTTTANDVIVFYAQWKLIEYDVHYQIDDGNGGTIDVEEHHTWDDPFVAPNAPGEKPGYEFGGWNTKEDGSGDTYQPGDPIYPSEDGEDLHIYPVWIKINGSASPNTGATPQNSEFSIADLSGTVVMSCIVGMYLIKRKISSRSLRYSSRLGRRR